MKDLKEKFMKYIFLVAALMSILVIVFICFFLFSIGIPAIGKIGITKFLFGQEWSPTDKPALFGILPMILGSIYVTICAIAIGVPIGILTSVFMARFCHPKIYKIFKPAINLLAGIPSIIYGFFGMIVITPIIKTIAGGSGSTILTAGIVLGIMILPTIIGIAESAIRAVPNSYYEGALALGASHERSVFLVLLPAANSGVFAAVVLGIGRAIGETMAVVMVAGNQARMPSGLFKGIRTLTANIVLEMGYATNLHREALIATGVVLFIFILLINFSFSIIKRKVLK